MPDLASLQVFLAVAHANSLSAAARQLGVTQQAVSARITGLEAQTGIPLLNRTRQGSTLTSSGAAVAEWTDRLLAVAAEFDAGLASLRHDRRTKLTISASLTVAEQLLPRWLITFSMDARRRNAEQADVTMTATNSTHVIEAVHQGTADLGFIEGPTVPRGLRYRVVGHDELLLVVRPDHPWARRRRLVSSSLLAETPLISRELGSGTREALEQALSSALGPHYPLAPVMLEFSTTSAVRASVLEGVGPAVLSALAVADDIATGRLRRVEVHGVDLRRTLRAVWRGPRTPPAGAVRDLLAHIAALRVNGRRVSDPGAS